MVGTMTQKLKLHSPVGSDPLILKWPVPTSEGKDGPEEILDTIRLVCDDYPELKTPLETRILKDGEDVSNYDFEQTKAMCERYNKAIDSIRQLVKGQPRQKVVSKQASMKQLKHILQQCYNHSVKDPEKLNHYEPFSPEVYGETSFELVEQMIKYVKFSESDYFIDLGSGVGQVVLQVSAATNCKFCYGVEKAEWPAEYAQVLEKEFKKWMKWFGKEHSDFQIEKGDFLHDDVKEKLSKATIVFVNNFAFGPVVDHELKQRFANCLKEGARIVSSKAFCPLNFRITARNLSDIGTIMQVEELSPLCGAVSWTGKPFAYYVHTIDRTLLEKYFQRLRFPSQKNEDEPRKDRKGRPLLSIKDKINGALSGGSDSNSSGRWRRAKGAQRETETASPLSAAKVLDFDSESNSSFTNSASVPATDDTSIVYGPTTRRQWNEYVKRPQSQSGTENDNDSSAADANSVDLKVQDQVSEVTQKKKKMKSVKRLNNGALGMRKMQGKKHAEPVASKAAVKLRPRKKQTVRSSSSLAKRAASVAAAAATAAASTASSVSTTTSTVSGNASAHVNGTVTPSLDSLNLLHAHTIMSTSGKDPAEKVNYNDRRMTETSSAYFKPTVQKQTVSMLEKEAGFLQMMETMKQRFLSFLTFMQTPEYRAMLLLQIEQEKRKNSTLSSQTDSLEKDISVLQKEGVRLIKERLKEMGIKADTPRELISQAKDIMLRHHELKSQTASLGAQINALQTEHTQKVMAYRKVLDRKLAMRHAENGFSDHTSHMDKERLERQILLASINRLHTELQHLQNVNKPYVVRPETGSITSNGLDMGLNLLHDSREAVKGKDVPDQPCLNSYMMEEKLDMKENYDAFGTVLAMVKKELTSTLQNGTPSQNGVQAAKIEPDQAFDRQIDNAKQDTIKKAPPVNIDMKSNSTAFCVKDVHAANAHCNNIQSFKAPGIVAKDVAAVNASVSQISSSSSSSSWTSELRKDGIVSNASPRILPPGMKIDIKKPSRLNGLNSALKARLSNPHSYTVLQNPENSLSQNYKVNPNGSFSSVPTFSVYTETEKSAAEDLISLKEGLNTSSSSLEPQSPIPSKIPVSLSTSSLLSSSLSGIEYLQSHSIDSKSSNRRHSPYDKHLAVLVTDKAHTGSSNSLSKDSSLPCAISPSSTPHVFAQVPVASFSQIGSSSSSSNQLASQNSQPLSTSSPSIAHGSVKIIANLPKNGLLKHKNYDTSIVHRPVKIRTLETGSDVKLGMTSVLPSVFRAQPQHQAQIVQTAPAGANLAHHVLMSEPGNHLPSQSFLNAHMSQTVVVSTASGRSMGSGSLPFVTIQSPHAIPVGQGSNGLETSVLKILQQKPVVISTNNSNSSVGNGAACSSSSAPLAMSSPLTSHVSAAQSDAIGQAVKILPQNGRDSKGCLHSSEASSLLVSDFDACEPVSPPEQGDRCRSSHTFLQCRQQALSTDWGLDWPSDTSQGVVHDQKCLPADICIASKSHKYGRLSEFIESEKEIPPKVSRLSSDFALGCVEAASQRENSSDEESSQQKQKMGIEALSVKERPPALCSGETNGNSVSVLLKREAKLERMVENISSCDYKGKGNTNTEPHVCAEPGTVVHSQGKEPRSEESGERSMFGRNEKENECEEKNPVFDTDVTSSQLTISSVDSPVESRLPETDSLTNKTDCKFEPLMKNLSLSVDRTGSRSVDHSADSHESRHCRHQQRFPVHRDKNEMLSVMTCVNSPSSEHTTAVLSKQTARNTESTRKTSSSYISDQSKTLKQREDKVVKSDKKCNDASSDISKTPAGGDMRPPGHSTEAQVDCFSGSLKVKHEKQHCSRHSRSSASQKHRGSSASKTSTSFTKGDSTTVKFESKPHRNYHSSDSQRNCSPRAPQSSLQKPSNYTPDTGKAKSLDKKSDKKKAVSSSTGLSSFEGKHEVSARSSKNHPSRKQREMSPGPPKLERAVTPPPSQPRRHATSRVSKSSCKGGTGVAHSDTADIDLWSELGEDLPAKCNNDHHRAKESLSSSSCRRELKKSDCRSLTKELLPQRSRSRSSANTERNSTSPTLRRHSKSGSKELIRGEIQKEKDGKLMGTRSERIHKSCSETTQSRLRDKLKSEHVISSKAASGSAPRYISESHKSESKYSQSGEESHSVRGSRKSISHLSLCDRTSGVTTCEPIMKSQEDNAAQDDVLARDAKQSNTSAEFSGERSPHTEVPVSEPANDYTLSTNLDSPYSLLTPKSISQNCQMDEDKNGDCPGSEVFEPNEKYSLGHTAMTDLGSTEEMLPSRELGSDSVVNISAPDAESFPFPPTPGKTPRSASVPCSPCAELNNQASEETNEVACEEVKPDSSNSTVRKGPQTPPGSPLFNHQSQSRCRSLSVSSSSSRGSSCDSLQSTTSSSSFTDSSSDNKKRRKRRRYQHLKTPPRKLSTLITQTLGMGSPPKATALYSPMPSPSVNGLNYGSGRLGTTPSFGNHSAGLGSLLLSPLSISTQQSPGYQMVTSDSLRSPSGPLRSPVSGSLVRQNPFFPNTQSSPVSTVPPTSSSSQSHLGSKDCSSALTCKQVSSKDVIGDCKNMISGTLDCKSETLPQTVSNTLPVSNRLSEGTVGAHPTDIRLKPAAVEEAASSTLDAATVVKDHNGNNTTIRCSHSSHLQQAHASIDYRKDVCQLPASLCSTSTTGSKIGMVVDAKCSHPSSDFAALSCSGAGQLESQLVPTTSDISIISGAVVSYSDQGGHTEMTIDKNTQQSPHLLPRQSSSSPSFIPTILAESSSKIVDTSKTVESGHNIPYLPCSQKQELQFNPLPAASELPNSTGHTQQVSLLRQSKRQTHPTQSYEQLYKLPSFHEAASPPPLPHQQLQLTQRQVQQKCGAHAQTPGHFGLYANHSYKNHNLPNRRTGFGFRLPLATSAPPHWGHAGSKVYPGPYCPNGSTLLSRSRHAPPPGPVPGFRDPGDGGLPEHIHNGIMDYPPHGTLAQPYGSGQWDHSAPLYCMGSGPGGLGRSVHQQYNRSYHHKHH